MLLLTNSCVMRTTSSSRSVGRCPAMWRIHCRASRSARSSGGSVMRWWAGGGVGSEAGASLVGVGADLLPQRGGVLAGVAFDFPFDLGDGVVGDLQLVRPLGDGGVARSKPPLSLRDPGGGGANARPRARASGVQ